MLLIQLLEVSQKLILNRTGSFVGWGEVENPRLARPHNGALKQRRQPSVRPVENALDRNPGRISQRDERGQVVRLGPEPVRQPAAQRRPTALSPAGVHRVNRLPVIIDARVHRPHDDDVVHHAGGVRQKLRDVGPALTVLRKLPRTAQRFGACLRRVVVLDLPRKLLPVQPIQYRLRIQQVHLTRTTLHEQRNHRRRFGLVIRLPSLQRKFLPINVRLHRRGRRLLFLKQPGKRDRRETEPGGFDKLTAGKLTGFVHRDALYCWRNSARRSSGERSSFISHSICRFSTV